jgi:hypothetical protein
MTSNYAKVAQRYVFGDGSRSNRTTTASVSKDRSKTRPKETSRRVDAPVPQNSIMQGGVLTARRRRGGQKSKAPSSLPIAMTNTSHQHGTTIGRTNDIMLSGNNSQPSTVSVSSVIDPPNIVDDTMPMSQLTMPEFSQEPSFSAPASSSSSTASALVHDSQLHQPSGSHATSSGDSSLSLLSSSGPFRLRRAWMQRARELIPTKTTALPLQQPSPPVLDSNALAKQEIEQPSITESLEEESSSWSENSKLEPFGSKITDHFKPKLQSNNDDDHKVASLAEDNEDKSNAKCSLQKMEQDIIQRLNDKEQSIIDKIILQLKEQAEAEKDHFTDTAKKIAEEEIVKIHGASEAQKLQQFAILEKKGKDLVQKMQQASLEEITKIGQAGGAMIAKINDLLPSIKTAASKAIEDVLAAAKNATSMLSGTKRKQEESFSSSSDSVCVTPLKKRMRSERRKVAPQKTSDSTVTSRSTTQPPTSKTSTVTQPSTRASSRTSKRAARSIDAAAADSSQAKHRKTNGLSPTVQTPLGDTAGVTQRVPTSVTVRLPFEESTDAAALTPSTNSYYTPPRNKSKAGCIIKSTNNSGHVIGSRREDGSIVYATDEEEEGLSKSSAPQAAASTRKAAKSSNSMLKNKSNTKTRKTYTMTKHHGSRKKYKKNKGSAGASSITDPFAFADDDAFKFLDP